MWFSFRERGEEAWLCLGCLPIKHDVCCLRFLCMCSARYYRWKWLEGHTSSTPQNTILRSSHSYTDFVAWFARIVTGKHLCTVIWDAHFKLRFATWFAYTRSFLRILNFNSKCASRIKIQNTHFAVVWKQSKLYVVAAILRTPRDPCTLPHLLQHCDLWASRMN